MRGYGRPPAGFGWILYGVVTVATSLAFLHTDGLVACVAVFASMWIVAGIIHWLDDRFND